jgi:hypothetical protein
MVKRKFLICAPSYSSNNGGAIVLHKLCHLINNLGREAYLFPLVDNIELNKFNYKSVLVKFFKKQLREPLRRFKKNPTFQTPNLTKRPNDIESNNWIIVYPEITFGNPLGAKNVVRWFLHNPGFHTKKIYFNSGELYFRISERFNEISINGSKCSNNFLQVFHFPLNLYNLNCTSEKREGTAYCLRKGKGRKIVHDLSNSILIDNLNHDEISAIFKRIKQFISYDTHTTFSYLAALCGCDSIIIPDEGIAEEEWLPNPQDRFGLAYGFDKIESARKTRHLLLGLFDKLEKESIQSTENFIEEADKFFSNINQLV